MLKDGMFLSNKFRKLFICQVFGWIVYMLGTMADSMIAGLYLDSDAVAAVGLVAPLTSIAYFLGVLVGMGSAILFSKNQGAFKYDRAHKMAGMGASASIVLGIAIVLNLVFAKNIILDFYGVTGELLTYAEDYYVPVIAVCGMYPILNTIYYLVNYDGDEKVILAVDVLQSVLNAVFSLMLVKSMGTAGLGYGTLLGNIVGPAVMILHFVRKTNSVHFKMHFALADCLDMLKAASAFAMTTCYIGVINIVFNKVVIEFFSADYLPAYTVINTVLNFAMVMNCAVNAGSVFATVAYGEKNINAVKRAMRITTKYTAITSILIAIVMEAVSGKWALLYGIENPEVIEASVYAGRIIPIFFIIVGFVYTFLTYYPIVDKPVEGNILAISYLFTGPLVIALPLGYLFGFNAMSLGFAITPVFAVAVTLVYIAITKQIKRVPLLLEQGNEKEAHFDFRLDLESISKVRNTISDFLNEQKVDSNTINKVQMVFEDAMVFIMKKNTKSVICECSVLVSDEYIRLITKDNGVVFDLIKEADSCFDLQSYIFARMTADAKESSNSVTTSFNRNVCIWER